MKVTCLDFAGVETCTKRVHGKVRLAGTHKCRDLEETEQLRGEKAVPEGGDKKRPRTSSMSSLSPSAPMDF